MIQEGIFLWKDELETVTKKLKQLLQPRTNLMISLPTMGSEKLSK